jgi:hypothetical protein
MVCCGVLLLRLRSLSSRVSAITAVAVASFLLASSLSSSSSSSVGCRLLCTVVFVVRHVGVGRFRRAA